MLSVVVPVYNPGDKFLSCVNSLLNQTITDLEIILVDDGSFDGSAELCDRYVKQYINIRCVHISNSGVSFARNTGLSMACGEYISFLDSDDWIEPIAYQNVLTRLTDTKADIAFFGMQIDRQYRDRLDVKRMLYGEDAILNREEIAKNLANLYYSDYLSSSCTKVYRNRIIQLSHIRFNEKLTIYEDLCFVLDYLNKADKVALINDIYYHYRMDTEIVAITKRKTDDLLGDLDIIARKIFDFFYPLWKSKRQCDNYMVIIDIYLIYIHKLFAAKNSLADRTTGIRRLERIELLQRSLCACPKFFQRSRFYNILGFSLTHKATAITYFLYRRKYLHRKRNSDDI